MQIVKTFEGFMQDSERSMMHLGSKEMNSPRTPTHEIDHEKHHEVENYMMFGNLETIKRLSDIMLKMDPKRVDEILKNGHSWAVDHIATSKDDIEEVANFLINEMSEVIESSTERSKSDGGMAEGNYTCNECGSVYEASLIKDGDVCECGGALVK